MAVASEGWVVFSADPTNLSSFMKFHEATRSFALPVGSHGAPLDPHEGASTAYLGSPTCSPHASRTACGRASLRSPARDREPGVNALDGAARAAFAPLRGHEGVPCGATSEDAVSPTASPHASGGSHGTLAGPRVRCESPTRVNGTPTRAPTRSLKELRNGHSRVARLALRAFMFVAARPRQRRGLRRRR
jgi:hypothetical protein